MHTTLTTLVSDPTTTPYLTERNVFGSQPLNQNSNNNRTVQSKLKNRPSNFTCSHFDCCTRCTIGSTIPCWHAQFCNKRVRRFDHDCICKFRLPCLHLLLCVWECVVCPCCCVDCLLRAGQAPAISRSMRNCNVPYRFAGNPSLGKWVHNLRTRYKQVK